MLSVFFLQESIYYVTCIIMNDFVKKCGRKFMYK